MTVRILKHELKIQEEQIISFPGIILRPLCVQVQHGVPTIWVECGERDWSPEEKMWMRIRLEATGSPVMYGSSAEICLANQYLGTVQVDGYVWHYFWEKR
jgi:hypothetical protein